MNSRMNRRTSFLRTAALGLVLAAAPPIISTASADFRPEFLRATTFTDGSDFSLERQIVPGVTHRFISTSQGPLAINVVEIDTTRPDLEFESEAGNQQLAGREVMPDMVARMSTPERRHVTSINADFFEWSGPPVNFFVDEEMIWRAPREGREVYAFDEAGNHWIGLPDYRMTITAPDGSSMEIHQVNFPVSGQPATIYTWPIGLGMPRPAPGVSSVTMRLEQPRWVPNETVRASITDINAMPTLPLARNVVHLRIANGAVPEWLKPGTEVTLAAEFPHLPAPVVGAVGGFPQLVKDGEPQRTRRVNDDGTPNQGNTVRHPRSIVGTKDNGRKVVFVTVDGRQAGRSIGIGFADLAELMIELGVEQALNLDGGGSTTLMIGDDVVNFPSDAGGPRPVSNALFVFRTADLGELQSLRLNPDGVNIPTGTEFRLGISGLDDSGETIPLDEYRIEWSIESGDASIDGEGRITIGFTPGQIIASATAHQSNRIVASSQITLNAQSADGIRLNPEALIIEEGQTTNLSFNVSTATGETMWTSSEMWSVAAPDFIEWDHDARTIRPVAKGSGNMVVRLGEQHIALLPVAVGEFKETIVQSFDRLPDNDVDLDIVRADEVRTRVRLDREEMKEGAASWRLEHTMERGGISRVDVMIEEALPQDTLAVGLWVRGSSCGSWLRGDLRDVHGQGFYLNFTELDPGINWSDEWRFVQASIHDAPSMGSTTHPRTPPFSLRSVYVVQINDDNKAPGTVWFDNLVALSIPE